MALYGARLTHQAMGQVLPHIVETTMAEGVLGGRLDAMHAWYWAQGGQHDESKHHVRWRFANPGTAIEFAAKFGGTAFINFA